MTTLNDGEEEGNENFFVVLFPTTQNPTQIRIDSERGEKTVTITDLDGNSKCMCKNIFIKMLKDVGMAVPKPEKLGWYICHKTKDYGIQQ